MSASSWTPEQDEALALAVRTSLFDFRAAATLLVKTAKPPPEDCDADSCRQRWAALDLGACMSFAKANPADDSMADSSPAPSDFNIFHNNLSQQMDTIFSGVRAELPSMAESDDEVLDDDGEDESDDDDSSSGRLIGARVEALELEDIDAEPAPAPKKHPAAAPQAPGGGAAAKKTSSAQPRSAWGGPDAAAVEDDDDGDVAAAARAAGIGRGGGKGGKGLGGKGGKGLGGRGGGRGGRGGGYTATAGDEESDESESDDEDFRAARRNLKDRAAPAAATTRTRHALPVAKMEEESSSEEEEEAAPATKPRMQYRRTQPPGAAEQKKEEEEEEEEEEESEEEEDEEVSKRRAEVPPSEAPPPHAKAAKGGATSVNDASAARRAAEKQAARFVASKRQDASLPIVPCSVVVEDEVKPPASEEERKARASRVQALASARGRVMSRGAMSGGASGGDGDHDAATGSAASAPVPTGDLCDETVAKEPPIHALPPYAIEDATTQSDHLFMLHAPIAAAALPELPSVLGELLARFPIATSVTANGLVALHVAADVTAVGGGEDSDGRSSSTATPAIRALIRSDGRRPEASWRFTSAAGAVTAATSPVAAGDEAYAPFLRTPHGSSAVISSSGDDASDGDRDLDAELAPGGAAGGAKDGSSGGHLPRTVVALKEHALNQGADIVLGSLTAAGLTLAGARLVYLPLQLGSSAQLGLDSPISAGPTLALLVEGYDACERVQALAGASDPKLARSTDVGSWRARLGVDRTLNVCSTPRHAKGAHRAVCYFFGPRSAAVSSSSSPSPPISLALRQPRQPLLVLTNASPAPRGKTVHPAARLLSHMQRAGMALHVGARASADELAALDVTPPAALDAPYYVFLLSREGPPTAYAQAALFAAQEADTRDGLEPAAAEFATCAPEAARQLLQGRAGSFKLKSSVGSASCTVDMYNYMAFALKSDLL